jgi:hypothetical protein
MVEGRLACSRLREWQSSSLLVGKSGVSGGMKGSQET